MSFFAMWVMYCVWGMLTAIGAVGLLGAVVGLFVLLGFGPRSAAPAKEYLKLVGWSVLSLIIGVASIAASVALWARL